MKHNIYLESDNEGMKTSKRRSKRGVAPSLGWRFTDEEERRMTRAKLRAKAYMSIYGHGRKPYMIDRTHYYVNHVDQRTQNNLPK